MSKLLVSIHSKSNLKLTQKNTTPFCSIFQYCHNNLIEKYNSQRQCLHMEIIDNILDISHQGSSDGNKSQFKIPVQLRVRALDQKFNDQFQYLTKFYGSCDSIIQMAEMCEYYKYYMQEPFIATAQHFRILYCHSEKKKEIVYKKIKKLLNYSQRATTQQNQKSESKKTKGLIKLTECQNFLKGISLSYNESSKDQSKLFEILRERLVKKYGKPNEISMKQIDKLYNFQKKIDTSQLTILKKPSKHNATKLDSKMNPKRQLFKNLLLQSTNNSTLQFQSNFNCSKSYIQYQADNKTFQNMGQIRKKSLKKNCDKKASSKKVLNPYRSSCEFSKRVYTNVYKQQTQPKKKLRKRSCENFQIKKFKTISNENLNHQLQPIEHFKIYEPHQQNLDVIAQAKDNKQKKIHSRRNQINSCSSNASIKKFDSKYAYRQKQRELLPLAKAHSPTTHTASNKDDIKKTIQRFKNKIRQQMKQFVQLTQSPYIMKKQLNKCMIRQSTQKQKQKSSKKIKNPTNILISTKKSKKMIH